MLNPKAFALTVAAAAFAVAATGCSETPPETKPGEKTPTATTTEAETFATSPSRDESKIIASEAKATITADNADKIAAELEKEIDADLASD